jgi:hypothetical protein
VTYDAPGASSGTGRSLSPRIVSPSISTTGMPGSGSSSASSARPSEAEASRMWPPATRPGREDHHHPPDLSRGQGGDAAGRPGLRQLPARPCATRRLSEHLRAGPRLRPAAGRAVWEITVRRTRNHQYIASVERGRDPRLYRATVHQDLSRSTVRCGSRAGSSSTSRRSPAGSRRRP